MDPVSQYLLLKRRFFPPLSCFDNLVINRLTINLLVYFWTFYFVLLIFVFMPKLQSLNCCSTVLAFKIGKCEFSNFFVPISSKNYSFIDCISINCVYLYFNNIEDKKNDKNTLILLYVYLCVALMIVFIS